MSMNDDVRLALEAQGVVFEERLGSGGFAEVWRVRHRYVEQVAQMIDLLNQYGFHHRDAKAVNILVCGLHAALEAQMPQ